MDVAANRDLDHARRVRDLFDEVVDLDPPARDARLDAEHRADAAVAEEVRQLLAGHDRADRVLERLEGPASPDPTGTGALEAGQTVSHYRVLDRLGSGGMGVVYRAEDTRLRRTVALKFLPAHLASNEQAKGRFLAEARAAAALDHPHVCTIHDVGEAEGGDLFIAMAYCEGETLKQTIARGPLPLDRAVRLARQIAWGLQAAHARGVVHRDVKPANVMVSGTFEATVVDFGIAKVVGLDLTRNGVTLGTCAYMSPEQARGEPVDHRTDIWSLGVVLYEMLTGESPFAAAYEQAVIYRLLHESPAPLSSGRPDAPPALARVVEHALAKDRQQRYDTLAALLHDLGALDTSSVAPAGHTHAPPPATAPPPAPTGPAQTTTSLLPERERRQATVVASSLAGYTSLVEQLAPAEVERVMARVRALADEVARRHGGLVNACHGDEVDLVFGVPVTHEDDAVRAVRAARDLHAGIRDLGAEIAARTGPPLRLCTGIDTGIVVAQHDTRGDRVYHIAGRPAQAAGALSVQAEPGEILATPESRRLTSSFFTAEAGTPTRMKGRAGSVTPYRIGEAVNARHRLVATDSAAQTYYVGRTEELARLNGLLDHAVAGEGQFVAVVGEAGLGKSRFLYEFRRGLDPDRTRLVRGHCQSHGAGTPYLPFIDALQDIFGLHEEDGRDRSADAIADRVCAVSPELEVFVPVYLHLLSVSAPEYSLPDRLDGDPLRLAIHEALAALFTLRAADGPVVILFEDWHWADDASRAALAQLVEVAAAYPLLIVVAYRPGYDMAWSTPALPTVLQLEPLDLDATLALLASVFGCERFPDATGRLLHERTGGNPFFLEEIARALSEEGVLRAEDGRVTAARSLGDADLPSTVQAVLRTRLHRMPPEAQSVLRVASVVGREFTRGVLEHVLDDDAALRPALVALRGADLIQQTRVLPEAAYRFKHALTQEAAYDSLLAHQRKMLHGRVGAAIEVVYSDCLDEHADLLAQHFDQAEAWDEAVTYGLTAARRAFGLGQYAGALQMYERARDGLLRQPEGPERRDVLFDVLLKQDQLCERMGLRERQQALVDEMRALVEPGGTADQRASVYQRQGDLYTLLQQYDDAEPALDEALRLRREIGDEEGERNVIRSLGMLCWHADRYEDAIRCMETAIEIDRRRDDPVALLGDLNNLGHVLQSMGRFDEAVGHLNESLALAEERGAKQLFSLHALARIYHMRGDLEQAKAYNQRAIDIFETERLDLQRANYFYLSMSNILWDEGKREESLRYAREAAAGSRRTGDSEGLAISLRATTDRLLQMDRYAEALPHLDEAISQYAKLLDPQGEALAWCTVAVCHEHLGDGPSAQTAWTTARTLFERDGHTNGALQALEGLAQTMRRLKAEPAVVREHFGEAVALARRLGDRSAEGRLRNAAGIAEWERGDFEAALPQFQTALICYQDVDDAVHQALMFNSIGVSFRKLGRPDEAVVSLEEGAATAHRAGQALLEGHALASLGEIAYDRGQYGEARGHFARSLELRRAADDRRGEGWMLYHLARTEAALGDRDQARDLANQAARVAEEQGDDDLAEACRQIEP